MRKTVFLIVSIAALVILAPAYGAAQQAVDRTSEISGMVTTTTEPGVPLSRVLVTLSGASLKPSRTVVTDERGGFTFTQLPAGSFTLVASRPPYVKTAFGARRPGRPGSTIELAAGQRLTGLRIALARGAAITGVVRNADGEPAPGIQVAAMPLDTRGENAGVPFTSDDRGVYRVFGLTPGRYLVRASVAGGGSGGFTRVSDAEMDEILARLQRQSATGSAPASSGPGATAPAAPRLATVRAPTYSNAPIYYPGTADPAQAQAIQVAEGEERGGIDLDLQLIPTAAVEGRVSAAGEPLPSEIQVSLNRAGARTEARDIIVAPPSARVDASGSFRFTNVLPGAYRIMARSQTMTPVPGSSPPAFRAGNVRWAVADIAVAGEDLSGVALTLQPGITVKGRVVFDGASPPPANVSMRVVAVGGVQSVGRLAGVAPGGTFEFDNLLPGSYTIQPASPAGGWSLRSVIVEGRDVLDVTLELGGALQVSGAVATFTDRHTELSGTVRNTANAPVADWYVVVFSADRTFWRAGSRRVQAVRSAADGRFTIADLPAGDYLVAPVSDIDSVNLADIAFLESLLPAAAPLRLGEGERKTQDITIAR